MVTERFPSAFFGADVALILRFWDVDTVVIAGCVTSGCIGASTIDAFSHGFRTIDTRRYADVLDSAEILDALRR